MELATCSHPLTALFVAVAFDALTLGRLGYYRLLPSRAAERIGWLFQAIAGYPTIHSGYVVA